MTYQPETLAEAIKNSHLGDSSQEGAWRRRIVAVLHEFGLLPLSYDNGPVNRENVAEVERLVEETFGTESDISDNSERETAQNGAKLYPERVVLEAMRQAAEAMRQTCLAEVSDFRDANDISKLPMFDLRAILSTLPPLSRDNTVEVDKLKAEAHALIEVNAQLQAEIARLREEDEDLRTAAAQWAVDVQGWQRKWKEALAHRNSILENYQQVLTLLDSARAERDAARQELQEVLKRGQL